MAEAAAVAVLGVMDGTPTQHGRAGEFSSKLQLPALL